MTQTDTYVPNEAGYNDTSTATSAAATGVDGSASNSYDYSGLGGGGADYKGMFENFDNYDVDEHTKDMFDIYTGLSSGVMSGDSDICR